GDGRLNQGENVIMSVQLHDYLAAVTTPSLTLSTTSPWITITDGTETAPSMVEDGDASLPSAFAFTVSPNAPPGTAVALRIDFAATGYSDFQYIPITLEPEFNTHDINRVHVSVTSIGNVGFVGFPDGLGGNGVGFTFDGGPNVLFESALLLGTSATHLSDAAR